MKDKKVREELIIDAFAMLFLLAGELYFFRNIIGTGRQGMSGDRYESGEAVRIRR